jgi:NAD(P)-dependent dehydrogenase (short-subunit alcohol dehydrogenase family)
MTSLSGKVIAITGAASGIGLATAHLLASRGASLSLADVQQKALASAAADIQQSSPKTKVYHKVVNVASAPLVSSWLDETITYFGALHGAANLAGILGTVGVKKISEMEDEDWDTVMDVNLKGVFNCLRAELQLIEEGGSIVNAASVAGLKGHSKGGAYCASKVSGFIRGFYLVGRRLS